MASVEEVLEKLKAKAIAENVEGMSRYGMTSEHRLGVSVPDIRKIAKEAGKNHELALNLWRTGIPEAFATPWSVRALPEKLICSEYTPG